MKALVTGATGLLGRCLVAKLRAEGVEVRAFVRPGRASQIIADEQCEGDLAHPETLDAAVAGVDWVFHTAARVSTAGPWEEFEAVNVRGTDELIARAADARASRIVHVSSLSVYDVPYNGAVISEDSPLESGGEERGSYARSKLAADNVARAWIARGAPVAILRPGLLYGPGRRPPLARRAVALGPLRLIFARRDYLLPLSYVENVCDAMLLAARKEAAVGRVYTVVDAHVEQADYCRLYRRISNQRWVAVHVPANLLLTVATGVEQGARSLGVRPPVTRHQVERTVRSARFSTARIEQELGWRPRVSLEETMRRSFGPPPGGATLSGS